MGVGCCADDNGDLEPGKSLNEYIEKPRVYCLNEQSQNMGVNILKCQHTRLSNEPTLLSDEEDPEMILYVPFTEAVTIQSVNIFSLVGSFETNNNNRNNSYAPKIVKIFSNREDLDFDTARDLTPDMPLELFPPAHLPDGTFDYTLRPAGRFQSISSITIYFGENWGGEDADGPTEISYVGFKGKGMKVKRLAVDASYESIGMKKDHKTPAGEFGATTFL